MIKKLELLALLVCLVPLTSEGTGQRAKVTKDTPYTCVWDSPTITCEHYGLNFNLSQFDIVQNPKDSFNGENITIFYGPGEFPFIDPNTKKYVNGGLPQLGNLSLHLEKLTRDVEDAIPDKNFQGLAVLDFEQWRPLFKHNFDSLKIYQEASEDLVKKEHPDWTNTTQEAEKEFDDAARLFFEQTLITVSKLRPGGRWGYYGFPRCYGQNGNYCSSESQADNDRLQWLWTASSALYPRIYLGGDTSQADKVVYLMSTVHEAVRLASRQPPGQLLVYPYSRHSYDHDPGHYYSQEDAKLSSAISSLLGGDGVVVWGSTKAMESESLCTTLHTYISSSFGLTVKTFTEWALKCGQLTCSGHGQCIAQDIPAEMSLVGASDATTEQKEWMRYFKELLSSVGQETILPEAYTCKCFPDWKGSSCSEQL